MLSISKNASLNYLAKFCQIDKLKVIEGADNIQLAIIDFQEIVVSKSVKIGDYVVYFPVECAINPEFVAYTNSFRDSTLNVDKDKKGFFGENGRVKAIKLFKGSVKSQGYVVPAGQVFSWAGVAFEELKEQEFDTINGLQICKKYVPKYQQGTKKEGKTSKLKTSRLVDGQVNLHVSTSHLKKCIKSIDPKDMISVTYKLHGSSGWLSNVLVINKLGLFSRLMKKLGFTITDKEFDIVYGSRRVIKNQYLQKEEEQNHYYGVDLWKQVVEKNNLEKLVPKGFSLYYEIVGYVPNTKSMIQKDYDYGCKEGENKIQIYRITQTTPDGLVTELSYPEIVEFCERTGLTPVHGFYHGVAENMYDIPTDENWHETFLKRLEKDYLEKKCFLCNNDVPAEGIVVRKESLFACTPYKLKCFNFLLRETKALDKGEVNIEDQDLQ